MKGNVTLNMYYNNDLLGYRMFLDKEGVRSKLFDCTPFHLYILKTVGVEITTNKATSVEMVERDGLLHPVGHDEAPFVDMQTILRQLNAPEAPYYCDNTEEIVKEIRELNLEQFGFKKPFIIGVKNIQVVPVTLEEHEQYIGILLSRRCFYTDAVVQILSYIAYNVLKDLEFIEYMHMKGYKLQEPPRREKQQSYIYYCSSCDKEITRQKPINNLVNCRCACGGHLRTTPVNRDFF